MTIIEDMEGSPVGTPERIKTYSEFWPFYLGEHKNALNRRLHFIGTTIGIFCLAGAAALKLWWLVLAAFICGYAFAWVGHFFVEKNRPATFTYPFWSFISDWRMWYYMLLGKNLWMTAETNPHISKHVS